MDSDATAEDVTIITPTIAILSEKLRNGGWMAICKPPMWEEYKDHDNLTPCNFTEDLIYLTKNTPHDDDFVLRIIGEPSPNEYDDREDIQVDNNEDA